MKIALTLGTIVIGGSVVTILIFKDRISEFIGGLPILGDLLSGRIPFISDFVDSGAGIFGDFAEAFDDGLDRIVEGIVNPADSLGPTVNLEGEVIVVTNPYGDFDPDLDRTFEPVPDRYLDPAYWER